MKKTAKLILLSIFLVPLSCGQNPPLETNGINIVKNNKNNFLKGTVKINFNFSDLTKNNGFNIKNLDLNNPEIAKLRLEVVGRDFTTITDEKNYAPGQSVAFQLQVPLGKNRVILLYTLDKMGNIISQIMGALDVNKGNNNANISFIDTVIAQVLYSIILDKNDPFTSTSSSGSGGSAGGGGGSATGSTSGSSNSNPFLNFNLNQSNTSLIDTLNLEDVKKFIYEYTGFNKEQNSYTKVDPLSFNSIGLAKELVKNHYLKNSLFPAQSVNLSGFATLNVSEQSPLGFSDKLKLNFSDLKSSSGYYQFKDLNNLGKFAMPGIWNLTVSKPGYQVKTFQFTVDPNCCNYNLNLQTFKVDLERSYHSKLVEVNPPNPLPYEIWADAKLMLNQDQQSGEITLNLGNLTLDDLKKENNEITIINQNGETITKIDALDGYYLLKDSPITISSDFLSQLKEGNLYFSVKNKITNRLLKGKIISNTFVTYLVRFKDSSNQDIINSKITLKSLEPNKNFISSETITNYYAVFKDIPTGKYEVTAEKEGYETKTKVVDITGDSQQTEIVSHITDIFPATITSIKFNNETTNFPTQPGDIGFKRPIQISGKDNNTNFVPNLDSNSNFIVSVNNYIPTYETYGTTNYKSLIIRMSFSTAIKRESFENNFKILSEISNTYNDKEIVRGTSSDDGGFIPAYVIDKNTEGAAFSWYKEDREVMFSLSTNLLWLNQGKELRYKLTFDQPFEDYLGQKAVSATSQATSVNGAVTSDRGGYIKYGNNLFADYLTFSAQKDLKPNSYISIFGYSTPNPKIIFALNKPLSLLAKSVIPKKDFNGNDINQSFIYDKVTKEMRYVDISGKIKPFAKFYVIKSGKNTEEAVTTNDSISYIFEANSISMTFDNKFYQRGDTIGIKLLTIGIDGSPPQEEAYTATIN